MSQEDEQSQGGGESSFSSDFSDAQYEGDEDFRALDGAIKRAEQLQMRTDDLEKLLVYAEAKHLGLADSVLQDKRKEAEGVISDLKIGMNRSDHKQLDDYFENIGTDTGDTEEVIFQALSLVLGSRENYKAKEKELMGEE